jgi:hypothetical protein
MQHFHWLFASRMLNGLITEVTNFAFWSLRTSHAGL